MVRASPSAVFEGGVTFGNSSYDGAAADDGQQLQGSIAIARVVLGDEDAEMIQWLHLEDGIIAWQGQAQGSAGFVGGRNLWEWFDGVRLN